jgi:hypothetical protein
VGQVALTHQSIKAELASIPDDRFLEVQYSEFCTNPESVFKQIKEKLSLQGFDGLGEYSGPSHFEEQDYSNMDGNQDMTKLEKAIETFASA